MGKTPDYTRKAVKAYQQKHDLIQVRFEKGTKERIKALFEGSSNEYITSLVYNDLERLEKAQKYKQERYIPDTYEDDESALNNWD